MTTHIFAPREGEQPIKGIEVWTCNKCHRFTCIVEKSTSKITWAMDEATHRFRHDRLGEDFTSFHTPFNAPVSPRSK